MRANPAGFYTLGIIFLASFFFMGSLIDRSQSGMLLITYLTSFVSYLLLAQHKEKTNLLVGIGLMTRLSLFYSLPSLSDDVYRFIWDGTLLKNAIHPFSELPSFYLDKGIEGIDASLYELLNSKNYFTIYPPINQLIFWMAVLPGGSWLLSANIIRTILLAADIGSFILLKKILTRSNKKESLSMLFFLNPLIILECVGNLHMEGLVIFFLLLGIYSYPQQKWSAALGFGMAIGTKLLPLIYLPFLFFKGLKSNQWMVAILAGAIACITLSPMVNVAFIHGMTHSLDLYFRSFEFNASVYFIAREVGFAWVAYNAISVIGPILSIVSLLTILSLSLVGWKKNWPIAFTFLVILSVYLLFTTTVHPWYILPLIVFGLLAGYTYPIAWSLLIFTTYLGYDSSGYELPMYIIVLEYLLLAIYAFFEFRLKKNQT